MVDIGHPRLCGHRNEAGVAASHKLPLVVPKYFAIRVASGLRRERPPCTCFRRMV